MPINPRSRPALTVEERLLRRVTSDQLHTSLQDVKVGRPGSEDRNRQLAHARALADFERAKRKNLVFSKTGKGKDMHRLNVRLQKSFKDMNNAIRDLRVAGMMKRTGPDYLIGSMNRMLIATESYMSLMRPLAPLMKGTTEINQQMRKSGDVEAGTMGSALRLTGRDLDLPDELRSDALADYITESRSNLRDGMEVGHFYFNWTKESMADGIGLVGEAVSTMKESLKSAREYMPPEMARKTEERVAKLEAQHGMYTQGEGDKAGQQPKGATGNKTPEGPKGIGHLGAESGATRTVEGEMGKMQEGLWASLSGDGGF